MPVWLFVALALATALLILLGVVRLVRASSPQEPTWHDYTSDRFFGMVWRWSFSSSGHVGEPWCFCPLDDTVLVGVLDHYPDRVRFRCDTCRGEFGPVDGDRDEAIRKVMRQIDRKLRTGEWKQAVRKLEA